MQKKYALFDFDGTLCKGDSIFPFCLYARRQKLCTTRQLLGGGWAFVLFRLGRITIEEAKRRSLAWMKGRSRLEMEEVARCFCRDVLEPNFFPDGIAALQKEKEEGAAVLLITASPSFYLEPMKEILGVSDVIGTRMDVDPSGLYTSLVGDNCAGCQIPCGWRSTWPARATGWITTPPPPTATPAATCPCWRYAAARWR